MDLISKHFIKIVYPDQSILFDMVLEPISKKNNAIQAWNLNHNSIATEHNKDKTSSLFTSIQKLQLHKIFGTHLMRSISSITFTVEISFGRVTVHVSNTLCYLQKYVMFPQIRTTLQLSLPLSTYNLERDISIEKYPTPFNSS
jgi:Fe2+ transport system protein B